MLLIDRYNPVFKWGLGSGFNMHKEAFMADVAPRAEQPKMTIGKAWRFYFACIVGVVLLGFLGAALFHGGAGLLFFLILYLVAGFIMNRLVLRDLVAWHPVYNTVENVSKGKLGMLLVWPVRYPVLFFKLLVVKHL
jgi:hypothetical protein